MVEFKARVYVAEILRSDSRGVKKNRLALEWVMPMWELPGRSAIGFAAVQDATNFDPVRSSNKEEPIIGDAEAEFISPVQCLHVILTRFGKALQTGKMRMAVDLSRPRTSALRFSPDDPRHRSLL